MLFESILNMQLKLLILSSILYYTTKITELSSILFIQLILLILQVVVSYFVILDFVVKLRDIFKLSATNITYAITY